MAMEAQRLVTVSLTKIAASRQQRGGASLHKNLLVASVLYKARAMLVMENYRSHKTPVYLPTPVASDDAVVPDDDECVDGEEELPTTVCQDSTSIKPDNSPLPTAVLTVESEKAVASSSRMKNFEQSLYANESLACDEELEDEACDTPTSNISSSSASVPRMDSICARKRRSSEVGLTEEGTSECKKLRTEAESSHDHVPLSNLVNCFNSSFVGLLHQQQQQPHDSGDCESLACATQVNSFEQHLSVPIVLLV